MYADIALENETKEDLVEKKRYGCLSSDLIYLYLYINF